MKPEPNAEEERPADHRKMPRKCTSRQQLRPSIQNVLEFITQEQHTMLVDWMLNKPMTYAAMAKKLADEHGIKAGPYQLSHFYRKHVYVHLIERRERAVQEATHHNKEIARNPADFQTPTMDALWMKAFREAIKPQSTLKELKVYVELLVKLKGQLLDERKVAMMQRRLKLLEKQVKAALDAPKKPRLSDAQFLEKMRTVLQGEPATFNGQRLLE